MAKGGLAVPSRPGAEFGAADLRNQPAPPGGACRARWHIALVSFSFVMGLYAGTFAMVPVGGAGTISVSVLTGIAVAFIAFSFCIAFERAVRRVWPGKLSRFVWVFDRRVISEPCGLAILRGTFVGLGLLGVDSLLVCVATTHLGMRLDSLMLSLKPARSAPLGTGWSVSFVTMNELLQGLLVALTVSFLASFFVRFARRRWLALFVAAVLATVSMPGPAIDMGAVQPYSGKFVILVLECLVLIWALTRFDVLTVVWAAFTFAFCWANYYLLVMFEPTEALEQWFAFAVFGLFVLAAAGVAFKSPLRQAYGRIAAAFE